MSKVSGYSKTNEHDELFYRSEMNKRQFKALAHRLTQADIENEIFNNRYFKSKVRLSRNCLEEQVKQWLKNSWNTECVLSQNRTLIRDSGQSFCMQWAFPQAYYAVYGSIMPFMVVLWQCLMPSDVQKLHILQY